MKRRYKYIYGPVPSWRLGSSLGIDPLSVKNKVCPFDCVYCQIGKTKRLTDKREVFVKTEEIITELKSLPPLKIDYITFSGTGEPTLAKNLGELIQEVKKIRNEKIAVLTNSALLKDETVREDLSLADFVAAKLDASRGETFQLVNKPLKSLKLKEIIESIKKFRSYYRGKFALQIMFTPENKKYAEEIGQIAKEIAPEEVQLNTPLRPQRITPLTPSEMADIKKYFNGLNIISVYNADRKYVKPVSSEDTMKRRGKV